MQAFELGGLFRPERARAVAHHLFRAHAGSLYAGKRLLRIVHKHVLIRTTGVSWAGFSGDFVRRTLSTGPHILSRLFRTAASHGAGKPRMPRGPNVCFRAVTVMAVRFFFVWPARTPRFQAFVLSVWYALCAALDPAAGWVGSRPLEATRPTSGALAGSAEVSPETFCPDAHKQCSRCVAWASVETTAPQRPSRWRLRQVPGCAPTLTFFDFLSGRGGKSEGGSELFEQ